MAFDDKFDQVSKLISLGKEKGYLLYEEVNDLLPSDVHSAEDLDDLLLMFDNAGIEVLDSPKVKSADSVGLEKVDELKGDENAEDVELDLTPYWTRPTTRCACISARWEPSRSSPAKARLRLPNASSAGSSTC